MTAEQVILLLARTIARLENALGALEAENAVMRARLAADAPVTPPSESPG